MDDWGSKWRQKVEIRNGWHGDSPQDSPLQEAPADCLQPQVSGHHLGLLAAGLGDSHMPFANLELREFCWK
ncbi:hypothetical protein llap_9332 [Limosa lapponica baueri]|uniref:Uncharacterized protein n=1 Tax=Limosa lapponica baueri TaxID=1758121 RepID=A0A2I0U2Q9_LIMLA|nr:hypothetical protein llap_9332 [Limosa lapponica baueri]